MRQEKSPAVGYLLAFFLGGLGVHLFYYKKYLRGILYLLFSWTYIPIFLGWIDMLFVRKWTRQTNESLHLNLTEPNTLEHSKKSILKHHESSAAEPVYAYNKIEAPNEIKATYEPPKWADLEPVESAYEAEKVEMETSKAVEYTDEVSKDEAENTKKDKWQLLKNAIHFYDEKEIILPEYSHLKAPRNILEHLYLGNKYKTSKNENGISISVAYHERNFTSDSLKYSQSRGFETKEIPFQSYWPTFRDLDKRRLKWYLYWREQVLKGNYIEVDLSYIFLFTYELLNYSFNKNAAFNVSMLVRLLENYKSVHAKLPKYLNPWIADMLNELGEVELAKEWDNREEKLPKLYREMETHLYNLERISINTWKPYIRNYKETVFFDGNRNKIYKKFKKSISLLNQDYVESEKNILEEWFEQSENREIRYLFNRAIVDRVDRQIHIRNKELLPTQKLYDQVSNLFRLAENIVRIESGENRQIKVNEEVLPENMREKIINHNRFKTVQTRDETNVNGSQIPKSPFAQKNVSFTKIKEESPKQKFELDWEEIDRKEKDLNSLTNKIEVTENDMADEPALNIKNVTTQNKRKQSNHHLKNGPAEDESDFLGGMFEKEVDFEGLNDSLTEIEKEFLLSFSDNMISVDAANYFARQNGMMLNFFVIGINEKADEYLDDVLLEINTEAVDVIEDYEDIILHLKDD